MLLLLLSWLHSFFAAFTAASLAPWRSLLAVTLTLSLAEAALAASSAEVLPQITVVGVIAQESLRGDESVALVRVGAGTSPARAVRVGDELARRVKLHRVDRDYIHLLIGGQIERLRVGESFDASQAAAPRSALPSPVLAAAPVEVELRDNQVVISATMREHLVGKELSTVLMQAAAVPYYEAGQLKGFRLLDIDKGSIYDLVGFRHGDIVTAIDGHPLVDVGMTVRLLNSMRKVERAEVEFLRAGVSQRLDIKVQ